jgi:hypothetical protein
LIDDTTTNVIESAMGEFNRKKWSKLLIQKNAELFSKKAFEKKMIAYIKKI